MIEYVLIDNKNMDILRLKLTGLEYKKIIPSNEDSESDMSHNYLNILGSPLYGRYDLPKTHLYSSLESNLKPINKFKNKDQFSHFCYGKKALNKIDCEKIDGSNIMGVWDKACENDEECPFYKINNKKGGCYNGQCGFPIGIDRISPRKYINLSNAVCSGCIVNNKKTSGTCCIEQKNSKLYPNLENPNFLFN